MLAVPHKRKNELNLKARFWGFELFFKHLYLNYIFKTSL
ncbi:hypothetical protein B4158_6300 [Bacillus cereus]|nr:hypothetical protein B4158_6300 [Bacillus cereus]